jgi:hypothetical protein
MNALEVVGLVGLGGFVLVALGVIGLGALLEWCDAQEFGDHGSD